MAKSRKHKKGDHSRADEPSAVAKPEKAAETKPGSAPAVAAAPNATGPIDVTIDGVKRTFDIAYPDLPAWIKDAALTSGGYPYNDKMKSGDYEKTLEALQIELVKLQVWLQKAGERVMVIFEGRDAAGKGGTIDAVRQYMNPRQARNVALPKPTETERGQWYFQRYVSQFPTAGEFVTFDRSWYNRAGVEPVMGFCTPEQYEKFLDEVPDFEKLIVKDGTRFFKFFLNIGQEMQLKRFHDRRHSPLTIWKFSPMDVAGMTKWDDYTRVLSRMFAETDQKDAPWIIVNSNDKRRARIETIRHILLAINYEGRDLKAIGKPDEKIIGSPKEILK